MNHFDYRDGVLHCEGVALSAIADAVGTPVYVYSSATLERHYRVFKDAFAPADPLIAYAVKANGNIAVIATLAKLGAGADTVSAGEIQRALAAGVPPERIVFSGVGKTEAELAYAISVGVHQINLESVAELDMLERVTELHGLRDRTGRKQGTRGERQRCQRARRFQVFHCHSVLHRGESRDGNANGVRRAGQA